jgi:tRNA (cytidine/uridine-2'-O-)-methyltransferase
MPDMPQNVGVIIRTAACLEFPLHIIKPLSFSMTDKRFKGAVMDYINYCDLNYIMDGRISWFIVKMGIND